MFKKIINSNYVTQNFTADNPFQITLHNGDNDLVCDHMEAEYFTENLKQYLNGETVDQRQPWRAYLPGGGLNGDNATVAGMHFCCCYRFKVFVFRLAQALQIQQRKCQIRFGDSERIGSFCKQHLNSIYSINLLGASGQTLACNPIVQQLCHKAENN